MLRISNHFVLTRAAVPLSSQRKQDQLAAGKVNAFATRVKRD
jgi:hypothetical protein